MIFDPIYNLPRPLGAIDFKDSSVCGGLLALFEHPQAPVIPKYFVGGKPRRHPMYSTDDFSRDQWIPLIAGLFKQDDSCDYRDIQYRPTNGDWLSPSHRDHVRRCCGLPDTWLGRIWFWFDIAWGCWIAPMDESNQLISMLLVSGDPYLSFYLKHCKKWRECIRSYWSGDYGSWRLESEWAEFMIKKLEEMK